MLELTGQVVLLGQNYDPTHPILRLSLTIRQSKVVLLLREGEVLVQECYAGHLRLLKHARTSKMSKKRPEGFVPINHRLSQLESGFGNCNSVCFECDNST